MRLSVFIAIMTAFLLAGPETNAVVRPNDRNLLEYNELAANLASTVAATVIAIKNEMLKNGRTNVLPEDLVKLQTVFEESFLKMETQAKSLPLENKWTTIRKNFHEIFLPIHLGLAAGAVVIIAHSFSPNPREMEYWLAGVSTFMVDSTLYVLQLIMTEDFSPNLELKSDLKVLRKMFWEKLAAKGIYFSGAKSYSNAEQTNKFINEKSCGAILSIALRSSNHW